MGTLEPKLVRQISPGAADLQVVDAIDLSRSFVDSTNGLVIIYFPEGTYYFNSRIPLTSADRNVVFQGAGSDKTMIVFNNS